MVITIDLFFILPNSNELIKNEDLGSPMFARGRYGHIVLVMTKNGALINQYQEAVSYYQGPHLIDFIHLIWDNLMKLKVLHLLMNVDDNSFITIKTKSDASLIFSCLVQSGEACSDRNLFLKSKITY